MIKTEAVSRKAQLIDSQFEQIREKLDYVNNSYRSSILGKSPYNFCYRDEKLIALESIYRNLGKALDLISIEDSKY